MLSESPSAAGDVEQRPSLQVSGAKRPRASDGIEFDVEELKHTLGADGSCMVLGIDEAGRGPVIGSMVYSGAMISLDEHDRLIDYCHVADSKMLDASRRTDALKRFDALKTFRSFTVVVTPADIAAAMTGRHGKNLNTLSHDAAIRIIVEATLEGAGKLCAVYVDTVGPPETYQSKLSGRFPHLRVTVAKKADSKFPVVSAASIVAKTTRDASVEALGVDVGCGYPSDPKAMSWVRSHVHRFFVFDRDYNFVRLSWGPVVGLSTNPNVCVPITFQQDEENENKKKGSSSAADSSQRRLTFAKQPPRRNPVFMHMLKLSTVTSLDD